MKDTGNMEERYFESCRKEFWQKVFRLEIEYLAERLKGCREVLSVGCGSAIIEGGLAGRGFAVTGLDISREMLNSVPDGVKIVMGRAEELPFPDNSFDAVIYVVSLQFVDDFRKALNRSAAVLRPNGRIVILLLNPASTFFAIKYRDPDSYISKIKHINLKAIESAVTEKFTVKGEYFLHIDGNDVIKGSHEAGASLYAIRGEKRAIF